MVQARQMLALILMCQRFLFSASTAGPSDQCRLPRGDPVPDAPELPGRRGCATRHGHGAPLHGSLSERLLPQGEEEGPDHRVEGRPHPQDLGQLQQFRAELPLPVLRVRREGNSTRSYTRFYDLVDRE